MYNLGFEPMNYQTIKEGAEALTRFLQRIAVAHDMSKDEVVMFVRNGIYEVMFEACPEEVYHGAWAHHACYGLISHPGKWHCEAETSYSVLFFDDTGE